MTCQNHPNCGGYTSKGSKLCPRCLDRHCRRAGDSFRDLTVISLLVVALWLVLKLIN
jgi:hypothetical protein